MIASHLLILHIMLCSVFAQIGGRPFDRRYKMPTNLAIDDQLIEEAKKIGHHRSKKAAVTEALEEYIQRRKQMRVIDLFGAFDFDPDYDYKAQRNRQ
jgi:hypothetical protein